MTTTPNFTYSGPNISPTFVVGVFNDAWERANERTATAEDALANIEPTTPIPVSALVTPVDHDLDLSGAIPSLTTTPELDPVRQAVVDQLKDLLKGLIDKYYPPVAVPNGADVWERIARAFISGHLFQALDDIQARTVGRGLFTPAMNAGIAKYLGGQRTKIQELMSLNVETLVTSRKAEFQLLYFEQVMKLQVDALEACRAFLLEAMLPLQTRLTNDLSQLSRFKLQLQSSYFKYLDARVIEGTTELNRLFVEKRINVTKELSDEERRAFIFDRISKTFAEEALAVSQQASAAINAVNADAGVTGREQIG